MSDIIFHSATTRFNSDRGWVKGIHYFNFGPYSDINRIAFGPLVILNDDTVIKGAGFAEHPHENMEIISLPLSGSIRHKDNTGMEATIHTGDIQIMSAGKGIRHSETNPSHMNELRFLQIWIKPNVTGVAPRYQQITMNNVPNVFNQVVSPDTTDLNLWIQQEAWVHLGSFQTGITTRHKLKKERNGLYILLIKGAINVAGQVLQTGDALSVVNAPEVEFIVKEESQILIIEVPLL